MLIFTYIAFIMTPVHYVRYHLPPLQTRFTLLAVLVFFPPLYASSAGSYLKAIISANYGSDLASLDNIEHAWIAYWNKCVAEWNVLHAC